jgi:hypothetical protein
MTSPHNGVRGDKPYARPTLVKGPVLSAVTAVKTVSGFTIT